MTRAAETDVVGTDVEGRPVLRRVLVRVATGPHAGEQRELERGSILIGKSASCDLVLSDGRVSRQHCELALLPGGVRIKDLGSTNGTFLRGARVDSITAPPPFEIELGSTRVEVRPADVPLPELPTDRTELGPFVGASREAREVIALLGRVAQRPAPTAIAGPEGSGKTTALTALVEAAGGAMASVPRLDLAVTDAAAARAILAVGGGFVHLDRVDAVTRDVQDVLRSTFTGPQAERWVPLSESRQDLRALVEAGALARELFFALAVVRVSLPPLIARPEDVPLVARALARRSSTPIAVVRDAVTQALADGLGRGAWSLSAAIAARTSAVAEAPEAALMDLPFKEAKARVVEDFGREYVAVLLARHEGNLTKAAEEAGIARNHLTALAKKYGLR